MNVLNGVLLTATGEIALCDECRNTVASCVVEEEHLCKECGYHKAMAIIALARAGCPRGMTEAERLKNGK